MNWIIVYTRWFRREVVILEGDGIGHCEKNFHMNICLFLNCYRDTAVWIDKFGSVVSGNKGWKNVTVCNASSKTRRQLQYNSRVGRWHFVRPSWYSSCFMWAATLKMRTVLLMCLPFFRQLHFSSSFTNVREKGGYNSAPQTQADLSR